MKLSTEPQLMRVTNEPNVITLSNGLSTEYELTKEISWIQTDAAVNQI
jgi:hypothetical protein